MRLGIETGAKRFARMKMRRDFWLRTTVARMVVALVVLVGILLALVTPLQADEETRRLLLALGLDTPARPAIAPPF